MPRAVLILPPAADVVLLLIQLFSIFTCADADASRGVRAEYSTLVLI